MNLKKLFINLGYTMEDYVQLVNFYPLNIIITDFFYNRVLENYNFLLSVGYTKDEIIKMTKEYPIYSYSIEKLKQKLEEGMALDYTKKK